MDKLELAKYLLEEVGMPPKQQSTLCCLALLAIRADALNCAALQKF